MSVAIISGYAGLVVFSMLSVMVAKFGKRYYGPSLNDNTGDISSGASYSSLVCNHRHVLYLATLAFVYPVVGLDNTTLMRSDSDGGILVGATLLNGLVWFVTLAEILCMCAIYRGYDHSLSLPDALASAGYSKSAVGVANSLGPMPTSSDRRGPATHALAIFVAVLTLAQFSAQSSRWLALLVVVPTTVVLCLYLFEYHISLTNLVRPLERNAHVVSISLTLLAGGAFCFGFFCALMGPGYGSVIAVWLEPLFALVQHTWLALVVIGMALFRGAVVEPSMFGTGFSSSSSPIGDSSGVNSSSDNAQHLHPVSSSFDEEQ